MQTLLSDDPRATNYSSSPRLSHHEPDATCINTTSKLGLPSNTLLRNQHGETRNSRQTKVASATTKRESNTHATKPTRPQYKAGCGQFKRLWHIFVRGRFGPCATRQIFVRGQFAPGKDVPGHRAQSPKLRTLVTSEFISSREVQSFRACGKDVCGQSSTIITSDRLSSPTPSFVVLSSNSSGRVLVTLVLVKQLTVKRTLSGSSQTRDVCGQSSTIITSDFVVLSSNSSGRVLVTLVLVKQLTVKRTSSQTRAP
jgi:hypothetical protein